MKQKIAKIVERLKNLVKKPFSTGIFKDKGLKSNRKNADKISASLELIEGVEIIDGDFDGELTSKPKMKRWKKALLITGGTIASLVVIVIIVYVSLVNSGKKKLYAGATSEKPNFRPAENETDKNGGVIKELDMYIDEDGNVVVFEGTNDNEGTGENSGGNTSSSNGNTDNAGDGDTSISLKNHTVSFEGVSENSNYDIIFDGVKYAYNKDIITLLVLGIDKLDEVKPAKDGVSGGQADTIFLLVINPHTKVMDILAIHRNSIALVDIYDKDNNYSGAGYTQICLQHAYGGGMEKSNQMMMESVSRMLYDLPIHSVTSINMGAIPELNDSIGGVTLKSMETFEQDGVSFTEGEDVTLKGKAAYVYVHFRNLYIADSAGMRLNRQKQYMTQFINVGISQLKSSVGKVIDVYNIIKKYVVTDLSIDKMTYLASEIINYRFGGIYSFEGELDKNPKWKYERYNLDEDKLFELLISKFYEKVG